MHSLKPPYHITFGSVSIFNVPDTAITASSRQGIFRENVWGGQTATAEGRETRGARVGVARAWVWGRAWVWPCIALPCVAGRAWRAVRGVWRPDGAQRMNGKAVRSHSGERTACICVSGAVAPEHFTFGNADLFRLADLLHFF